LCAVKDGVHLSPYGYGDLSKAVTGAHMSQLAESEFEDSESEMSGEEGAAKKPTNWIRW
jgi:hypothetical protein